MNVILNPVYLLAVVVLVPAYWLLLRAPDQRLALLSVASVVGLWLIEPTFVVLMATLAVLITALAKRHRAKRLSSSGLGIAAVLIGIGVLACCKYGLIVFSQLFDSSDWIEQYLIVPLGISYFALRLVAYAFDQLRGRIHECSVWKLFAFFSFFPLIPAGPLETYNGFYGKRSLDFDGELFSRSLRRIVTGFFKKIVILGLILGPVFEPYDSAFLGGELDLGAMHPLAPWGFAIAAFLRAYIDISAYTDIAIGISGLFGFRIIEDLDNPVFKPNLAAFWQSWHISVMNWCRDNVYFPIYGQTRIVALGTFASLTVMGLWHYVSWNWFFWGMYQASGLVMLHYWNRYKFSNRRLRTILKHKVFRPWGYVATFLFASLAFTIMAPYEFEVAFRVFCASLSGPFRWLEVL